MSAEAATSNGMTAKELTKGLLFKYNLFIKDLSNKMGGKQYLRLAVRNTNDNNKLIDALKKECSHGNYKTI